MQNLNDAQVAKKLLLHACRGPCSLEPVRVLRERGQEPHIFYANSNIWPRDEYQRRLEAINEWASSENLKLTEGEYDPDKWMREVGRTWEMSDKSEAARRERCRACYRVRFEEAAKWALEQGFDALGTTLTISPYQYIDVIREELERACANVDRACVDVGRARMSVDPAFEDWSSHYQEATRRSREMGMYRQNYCGCAYSYEEARREREERKARRKQRREAEKAEKAALKARQEKPNE